MLLVVALTLNSTGISALAEAAGDALASATILGSTGSGSRATASNATASDASGATNITYSSADDEDEDSIDMCDYVIEKIALSGADTFQQVAVGADWGDLDFPDKLILYASEYGDASASDADEATASNATASDADEATPSNASSSGTSSGTVSRFVIDLDSDAWKIAYPEADVVVGFDTSGVEEYDDEGNVTGESETYAKYPYYILIPDFDQMILDFDVDDLDMYEMLDGYEDLDDYLMQNACLEVQVGEMQMMVMSLTSTAGTTVDLTSLSTTYAESIDGTFDSANNILTLPGSSYTLSGNLEDNTHSVSDLSIVFTTSGSLEITLSDGSFSAYEYPAIEVTNSENITITCSGTFQITGYDQETIRIPENSNITFEGDSDASLKLIYDSGAAIGSETGTPGTISFASGNISIEYANTRYSGIALEASTIDFDENAVVTVTGNNRQSELYSADTITGSAAVLVGTLATSTSGMSLSVKKNGAADATATLTLGSYGQSFLVSLPAGSYKITGESSVREASYAGYLYDDETKSYVDTYSLASGDVKKYIGLMIVYDPVFWDKGVSNVSFTTATLYADVDTETSDHTYGYGSTDYYKGNLSILDRGFARIDEDGTVLSYYNAYTTEGTERIDNGNGSYTVKSPTTLDPQASSGVTDGYSLTVEGLEKGMDYIFVPYVRTSAGYKYGDKLYEKIDDYNPSSQGSKTGYIYFTTLNINWITDFEMTYGTMTTDDLLAQVNAGNITVNKVLWGATGEEEEISELPSEFVNVEGTFKLVKRATDGGEDTDTDQSATIFGAGDYTAYDGTEGYVLVFTLGDDEKEIYSTADLYHPVSFTVNKKAITPTGITNGTKVYDGDQYIDVGVITLNTADLISQDQSLASGDLASAASEESASFASADVKDAGNTITLSGSDIVLADSIKANYYVDDVEYTFTNESYGIRQKEVKVKYQDQDPATKVYAGVTLPEPTVEEAINEGNDTQLVGTDSLDDYKFSCDVVYTDEISWLGGTYQDLADSATSTTFTLTPKLDEMALDEGYTATNLNYSFTCETVTWTIYQDDATGLYEESNSATAGSSYIEDGVSITPKAGKYYDKIEQVSSLADWGSEGAGAETYQDDLTFTETTKNIYFRLVNSETGEKTRAVHIDDYYIDGTAPTVETVDWEDPWTKDTPVSISLSASDNPNGDLDEDSISGIKSVSYKLDGDSGDAATIATVADSGQASWTGSFAVSANGTYIVTVQDYAGHTNTCTVVVNGIDTANPANPSADIATDAAANDGWHNGSETYRLSSITVPAQKEANEDEAGYSPVTTWYVFWQGSADDVIADADERWQKISANSAAATLLSYDGGTYTFTTALSDGTETMADGTWYLRVKNVDEAGNTSGAVTYTIQKDVAAPYVPEDVNITYQENVIGSIQEAVNNIVRLVLGDSSYYVFQNTVTITIPVKDDTSGVKTFYYTVNGEDGTETINYSKEDDSFNSGSISFTLPLNTNGVIRYQFEDKAGNRSEAAVLGKDGAEIWILENTAPEIGAPVVYKTGTSDAAELSTSGWYTDWIDLKFAVTDPTDTVASSGLAKVTSGTGTETASITETDLQTYSVYTSLDDTLTQTFGSAVNGVYLAVSAYDNAGNFSQKTFGPYKVDASAPVISDVTRSQDGTGITDSDIVKGSYDLVFTVTEDDAGNESGVESVYVDTLASADTAQGTYTTRAAAAAGDGYTYTISANGYYRVYATDVAGNESYSNVITVTNIDNLAPVIESAAVDPTLEPTDGKYEQLTVPFVIKASDPQTAEGVTHAVSGLASYRIESYNGDTWEAIYSGSWPESEETATYNFSTSGTYTVRVVVTDAAGNTTTSDTVTFVILNTNPNLEVAVAPDSLGIGIDAAEPTWYNGADGVTFTLSSEVTEDIKYYYSDASFAEENGKYTGGTEITESATAAYTVKDEGVTTLYFRVAHTQNGYGEQKGAYTVRLDRTVPTTPVITVGDKTDTNITTDTWYYGSYPEITITPEANTNTTAPVTTKYKLYQGTEPAEYSDLSDGQPTITADGTWTLTTYSFDAAGNEGAANTVSFKVDSGLPQISDAITVEKNDNSNVLRNLFDQWFGNGRIKVTVDVTDSVSGVSSLHYQIEGETEETISGTTQSALESFTFTLPGDIDSNPLIQKTITLWAYDLAGNVSNTASLTKNSYGTWTLENGAPEITIRYYLEKTGPAYEQITFNDGGSGTVWYTDPVAVSVAVLDEQSGLNNVTKQITGEASSETVYEAAEVVQDTVTLPDTDSYYSLPDGEDVSISISAEDNSGNVSTEGSDRLLNIDTVAPEITLTPDVAEDAKTWAQSRTVTVVLADATSGVDAATVALSCSEDVAAEDRPGLTETGTNTYTFTATANGTYTINVKDVAGNSSENSITFAYIDSVTPTAPTPDNSGVTFEGTQGTGSWYKAGTENPYFTIIPAITGSGTSTVTTYYKLWSGDTEPTEAAEIERAADEAAGSVRAELTASGTWYLKVWAKDAAENEDGTTDGPAYSCTIYYDGEVPVVSSYEYKVNVQSALGNILNMLSFGYFFNDTLDVSFSLTDAGGSGLEQLHYATAATEDDLDTVAEKTTTISSTKEEKGVVTEGTATISLDVDFYGYIRYYVEDSAGNQSNPATLALEDGKVVPLMGDTKAPEIGTIGVYTDDNGETPASTSNENGWYTSAVYVRSSIEDAEDGNGHVSGLNSVSYYNNVNGADAEKIVPGNAEAEIVASYLFNQLIDEDGTYTITLNAEDNAQNRTYEDDTDNASTTVVKLDTTNPTASVSGNPESSVAPTRDITVTITDATSGSGINLDSLSVTSTGATSAGSSWSKVNSLTSGSATTLYEYTVEEYTAEGVSGYQLILCMYENDEITINVSDNAGLPLLDEQQSEGITISVTQIDASAQSNATVEIDSVDAGTTSDKWYNLEALGADNMPTIVISNPYVSEQGAAAYTTYYKLSGPYDTKDFATSGLDTTDSDGKPTSTSGYTAITENTQDNATIINWDDKTEDGIYTLQVFTGRTLGNEPSYSVVCVYYIKVDRTVPVLTTEPTDRTAWVTENQPFSFAIQDVTSGLAVSSDSYNVTLGKVTDNAADKAISITIDGSAQVIAGSTGAATYTFTSDGSGTYRITATDVAGNTYSDTFKLNYIDVDQPTAPTIGVTDVAVNESTLWHTEIPTLVMTVPDEETVNTLTGVSGVNSYFKVWETTQGTEPNEYTTYNYSTSNTPEITGDGIWRAKVYAQDGAGNRVPTEGDNTWSSGTMDTVESNTVVKVDITAPVIAVTGYDPSSNTANNVTVTFTVTEATSGIQTVSVTNGQNASYTATQSSQNGSLYTYTFTADVNDIYTITVTDNAGLTDTETATVSWIDRADLGQAGVTVDGYTVSADGTYAWVTNPAAGENGTLILTKAADTGTTSVETSYTLTAPNEDTTTATLTSGSTTFEKTLSDDGVWTLTVINYKVLDPALDLTDLSSDTKGRDWTQATYTIKVDRTAPDITDDWEEPTTWTNQDRTVNFTVTDPTTNAVDEQVSGIAAVNVSYDRQNAAYTYNEGTGEGTITASANGDYTITVTDTAGNESTDTITVTKIDKTVPGNANVILSTADGSHDDSWYVTKPTATIVPKDQDGASPITTYYTLTKGDVEIVVGGTVTEETDIFADIETDGVYTLKVWTQKEGGYTCSDEDIITKTIRWDTIAPNITSAEVTTVNDGLIGTIGRFLTFGNFFREQIKVTLEISDGTEGEVSGNYTLSYEIGGVVGETSPISMESETEAVFYIPLETTASVITLITEDMAGNTRIRYLKKTDDTDVTLTLVDSKDAASLWTLETTGPVLELEHDGTASNGWYKENVTFTVTAEDDVSGLNRLSWSKEDAEDDGWTQDDGASAMTTEKTVTLEISDEGTTTIDLEAEDNAGNTSKLSDNADFNDLRTIMIDKTAPEVSNITIDGENTEAEEWKQSKTIRFTVTDNLSGVDFEATDGSATRPSEVTVTWTDGETTMSIPVARESGTSGTGEQVYAFTAEYRGTYEMNVTDLAGNTTTAETYTTTIAYVSNVSEIPDSSEIAVDPASGTGNVVESALTQQYVNHTVIANWYSWEDSTDSGTAVYPVFTMDQPELVAAPITSYYYLWPGDWEDHSEAIADGTQEFTGQMNTDGWTDLSTLKSQIASSSNADGQWNIITWSESASGVMSATPSNAMTVYVDNTAPVIDADLTEANLINDNVWAKLINTLSFGIFFNEAIEVTVQVTDATSHVANVYYTYEYASSQDGTPVTSGTQTATVTLDNDDPSIATATFTLPLGTKGMVTLWAEDKAGNSTEADPVNLAYDNINVWVLESTKPQVSLTEPEDQSTEVSVDLESITLNFDEWVYAVDGGTVTLTSGSEVYTATLTANQPDGVTLEEAYQEDGWDYTIALSDFEGLELRYGQTYVLSIDGASFADLAGNQLNDTKSVLVGMFTTEEAATDGSDDPEIANLDLSAEDGIYISPEFDPENSSYMMLVLQDAMNASGTYLAEDLVLELELLGDVKLQSAELTTLLGATAGTPEYEAGSTGETSVTIAKEDICADENYFLKLTVIKNGLETVYTFFVSTSAITSEVETTGKTEVSVDEAELLLAANQEELKEDAFTYWKVLLKLTAVALADSAASDEISMVKNYLQQVEGVTDTSIGVHTLDISINKILGRNAKTEAVTELDEEIEIGITLPSSIAGKTIYGVYRVHDGTLAKLDYTWTVENKSFNIYSNLFSTYLIAYDEVATSSGSSSGSSSGGGGGGGGSSSGSGAVSVGGTVAYYGGTWYHDGWLFTRNDGTKPSNEWVTIDGELYYFGLDGFLSSTYSEAGPAMPEVEEPIQTAEGVWLKDGWRYVTASGQSLKDGWYYLYYQGRFEWYYFNADGWMLDNWFQYGGQTYYLHTVHDTTRGRMYTGWHFIDGKFYYFRNKAEGDEGTLLRSAQTPDGHYVDANGVWDGKGSTPELSD